MPPIPGSYGVPMDGAIAGGFLSATKSGFPARSRCRAYSKLLHFHSLISQSRCLNRRSISNFKLSLRSRSL
eukprot:19771-Pelagococcus_subviridis.AAC.2